MTQDRILAIGEVLWDQFDGVSHLGGAPLNFLVHASRMGHPVTLISAVGDDPLGASACQAIQKLGLDTQHVRILADLPTATASVESAPDREPAFQIHRPAAFDSIDLSKHQLDAIVQWNPGWLYYGTLANVAEPSRETLRRLMDAVPSAKKFFDINLRPGLFSIPLALELMSLADVVKFNETEMQAAAQWLDLPDRDLHEFCSEGSLKFGWQAACVTLGSEGCAVWRQGEYARAMANPVQVADTVGAGDACAAAVLHGLSQNWPVREIAEFANRVGAAVVSRPGAIPDWHLSEVLVASR